MKYIVVYSKITDDKQSGVAVSGVYFGGVTETESEADQLAERCVSETQGGIVMPKVTRMQKPSLLKELQQLDAHNLKMAKQIKENEAMMNRH